MQTLTHLLLAGATAPYISNDSEVQLAWMTGSIFPDFTLAAQFLIDKRLKKSPLAFEPPAWVTAKNICHSLILAIVIIEFGFGHWPIMLFGTGMGLHITIDIFTHKNGKSNCVYAWPFPLKSVCIWEYQIGDGILRPKRPELVICLLCAALIIFNMIR